MRISDWSSDVCSSDLLARQPVADLGRRRGAEVGGDQRFLNLVECFVIESGFGEEAGEIVPQPVRCLLEPAAQPLEPGSLAQTASPRSEEHTSELQSLMRI